MQKCLQTGASAADLVVDAPHSVQRRTCVGLLHRGVELALERLDVVLVVHLMIPRIPR